MKSTELRIGNLLRCEDVNIVFRDGQKVSIFENEIFTVCNVTDKQFSVKRDNGQSFDSVVTNGLTFTPIPLIEEWLLKSGFAIPQPEFAILNKNGYELYFCFDYEGATLALDKKNTEVKYVHQLQNLYFALTNEELEFK
jgi:hypothetical protein